MRTILEFEKIALRDEQWRTAAMSVLYEGEVFEEVVAIHAAELQARVLARESGALKELREHVGRASMLDAEAVNLFGADVKEGNFQHERMARRIMHHAGRTALEGVKSKRRRGTAWAKAQRSSGFMLG